MATDEAPHEITASMKANVESNIEELLHATSLSEPEPVIAEFEEFIKVHSQFDGSDEKPLSEAYDKLFDKSLVAIVNKLDEEPQADLSEVQYTEFYLDLLRYAKEGIKFELVSIKSHFKGLFEYKLRFEKDEKEFLVRAVCFVQDNNKIVRLERQGVEINDIPKPPAPAPVPPPEPKKVSGQVHASEDVLVRDFPTEAEIAKEIAHLPKRTYDKLLGKGTDLVPSAQVGDVIHLILTHDKEGLLGRKGKVTIETSDKKLYAGGASMEEYHRPVNQQCFVLKDKDGHPIALCVQDRTKIDHMYSIFGTQPMNEGDNWETKQGEVKMYPWYRVYDDKDKETHLKTRGIACWNGKNWTAVMTAAHHKTKNSNYSDKFTEHKGEIIITSRNGKQTYALVTRKATGNNNSAWNVVVAPGVDPALMICVSTVIEDFLGLFA